MNDRQTNDNALDDFRVLVGRLLDDCLEPGDAEKLRAGISTSEQFLDSYLDEIETHASLAWHSRLPKRIGDSVIDSGDLRRNSLANTSTGSKDGRHRRPLAVAAILAIAASIALAIIFVGSRYRDVQVANVETEDFNDRVSSLDSIQPDADGRKLPSNSVAAVPDLQLGSPSPVLDDQLGPRQNASVAVAKIGKSVAANWDENEKPFASDAVGRGWLQLESGTIRLDFFSGVRMVVRGPARLEIRSSWEVFLETGSISCDVGEHGKGFRVNTAGMDVVDLGTSFGMRVGPTGDPEIHVFSGKVAVVDDAGNATREIAEKQALQVVGGQLKPMPYEADGFTLVADLTRQANVENEAKFAAWRKAASDISKDRATIVHYTMDGQQRDDLMVINHAASATPPTDGVLIGCRLVEGRWPGKKAIQFEGNGDRILLAVREPQESLTAVMWIRVQQREQELMGLLMSEEPSRRSVVNASIFGAASEKEEAEFHNAKIKLTRWGLWNSGALHLGQFRFQLEDLFVPRADRAWDQYDTGPIADLQSAGDWNQVAVTYDSESQVVTQFLNGQRVERWDTTYNDSLRLGHLAIGNLSVDQLEVEQGVNREFIGAIDEVIISSRAFTLEEIRSHYMAGKP
jgi:YD repeat-containing protein